MSPRWLRLGYLHQDDGTRKYSLGPRVLRARLHGDQLDGAAARGGAIPSASLRRDRAHRQHGDPRADVDIVYVERFRSTFVAARTRSTSISTSVPGCRRTAPPWARSCSHSFPTAGARRHPEARVRVRSGRGPNTLTSKAALLAELSRVRATGIRGQQRGARLGLRSVAVPVLRRDRRGGRSRQPRRPPHDGLARRSRQRASGR